MRLSLLTCALTAMLAGAETVPPAPQPRDSGDHRALSAPVPAVWIGVTLAEVDDALTYHLGLSNDLGVMVEEIYPDSPAAIAGLKRFDVIIAVDDQPVYTPRSMKELIVHKKPGETVVLVVRRGAATTHHSATVAARPEQLAIVSGSAGRGQHGPAPRLGEPLPGLVLPNDVPDAMRGEIERILRGEGAGRDGVPGRHGRIVTPHGTFDWSASEWHAGDDETPSPDKAGAVTAPSATTTPTSPSSAR